MGDKKRAMCGDRARGGKAMDVGRMCVLHGAALWYTWHGVTAASCTAKLVGVLGACGCVTSVHSYSDPPIQLGKGQRVVVAKSLVSF